jgi:hypothetical protein
MLAVCNHEFFQIASPVEKERPAETWRYQAILFAHNAQAGAAHGAAVVDRCELVAQDESG